MLAGGRRRAARLAGDLLVPAVAIAAVAGVAGAVLALRLTAPRTLADLRRQVRDLVSARATGRDNTMTTVHDHDRSGGTA